MFYCRNKLGDFGGILDALARLNPAAHINSPRPQLGAPSPSLVEAALGAANAAPELKETDGARNLLVSNWEVDSAATEILMSAVFTSKAATQVFREAGKQPDAFYERSGRSLDRMGAKLRAWSQAGAHPASMARLQKQLDAMCAGIDAADATHARCVAVLGSPAKA